MKEGPERIDYQETPDVTEVHAAVKREHSEPTAEVTPIPLWLTGLCGLAVAWAGAYLGVFHGGFKGTVYNEYQSNPAELFPLPGKQGAGPEASTLTLAQQGKVVYGQCLGCHGAGGAGAPGQFPALAGAHWVNGSEKRLVAIILKGLTGPIEGKSYSGTMIAWEGSMPDKKIAAVATYIRQEWGNKGAEISEAKVAAARKEFSSRTTPWTEADLLQIPEDATLPDAAGAAPAGAPADGAKPAAPAPAGAPAPAPAGSPAPAPAPAGAPAPAPAAGAPAAGSFDLAASVERGKPLYMITCIACHQPTGMGLPGAFPPLAKSDYVTGDARRMVAIMLKGLQGPVTINGALYNNIMLPVDLQFPQLKDDKNVADVANFARNSFGNKAQENVTPELVTAVRAEFASRATPWTEADIKNFPAAPAK
jgi:mono/diheme cytochrome c family protein